MQIGQEELKKIVNDVFLVDIEIESRKRDVVDARKIYSKILRDSGYSYELIGKTINKNHATIMHYVKNIEHLMTYDQIIKNKYVDCKNVFIEKKKSILDQVKKDEDIYLTVARLTNELQEATSNKNKILDDFIDHLEQWEKTIGHLPNAYDLRKHILPLFNK